MNNEKIKVSKWIKIFVFIATIIVLCIFGANIVGDNSKEQKVIVYLQNKYNQEFEVIQLLESRQCTKGNGYHGMKKIKDKYQYLYNVVSKNDNIKFHVYYLSNKEQDEFWDSYVFSKDIDGIIDETINYIISSIGDKDSRTIKCNDVQSLNNVYSLSYDCTIDIYMNENFDEILSKNYITKLESIYDYIADTREKINEKYIISDENCFNFWVRINYNDDRTIYKAARGIKLNHPDVYINEYLEMLNKKN